MSKSKKIDKRMQKDIDKLKEAIQPEKAPEEQKDDQVEKVGETRIVESQKASGRGHDLTVGTTKIGLTCVFKKEDCEIMGIAMTERTKDAIKTIRGRLNLSVN